MIRGIQFGVASSLVWAVCLVAARAQEPKQAPPTDPKKLEELWAAYAALGPQHERFKRFVGEWDAEAKNFEKSPDQPQVTPGHARMELLLGGRFLRQTFTGEFDGKKFEGQGLSGFNNSSRQYEGVWMDNFGTGIMRTTGTYAQDTKTLTETGESVCPLGPMKVKLVTKEVNDDKFVFTMFMQQPDGKEQKSMEITYTRRK
jgi:hypothetical protein